LRSDERVYHINGQRDDDHPGNLRIVSRRAATLTDCDVARIKKTMSNSVPGRMSIRQIAREFGVSNTTVVAIRDGRFRGVDQRVWNDERGTGQADPSTSS